VTICCIIWMVSISGSGRYRGCCKCAPFDYPWPESIMYGSYCTCGCISPSPLTTSTSSAYIALISRFSVSLQTTAPVTPRVTCCGIDVLSICLLASCAEAQACIVSSLVPRTSDSLRALCLERLSCLSRRDGCHPPACATTIRDSDAGVWSRNAPDQCCPGSLWLRAML
jgi:hypothetical protein